MHALTDLLRFVVFRVWPEIGGGRSQHNGAKTVDDADMVARPIAYAISASMFLAGVGALVAVVLYAG